METMRTEPESLGFVEAASDKLWENSKSLMEMPSSPAQDVYEVRPRKDRDGFDLISNRSPARADLVCRTGRSSEGSFLCEVSLSLAIAPRNRSRIQ